MVFDRAQTTATNPAEYPTGRNTLPGPYEESCNRRCAPHANKTPDAVRLCHYVTCAPRVYDPKSDQDRSKVFKCVTNQRLPISIGTTPRFLLHSQQDGPPLVEWLPAISSRECAVKILTASGDPSDVHVVLQNAGANTRSFLRDVAT